MAASTLPAGWGSSSPGAQYQLASQLANGSYARFLSQQRGTRKLADIDRGMTRGLEGFATSYGRRGLRNSGIFKQAQNDYASGWANQKTDALNTLYEELRQASVGDANAWMGYTANVADTEAEKAQQILNTALQMQQLKSFMGGQ